MTLLAGLRLHSAEPLYNGPSFWGGAGNAVNHLGWLGDPVRRRFPEHGIF